MNKVKFRVDNFDLSGKLVSSETQTSDPKILKHVTENGYQEIVILEASTPVGSISFDLPGIELPKPEYVDPTN